MKGNQYQKYSSEKVFIYINWKEIWSPNWLYLTFNNNLAIVKCILLLQNKFIPFFTHMPSSSYYANVAIDSEWLYNEVDPTIYIILVINCPFLQVS
jgi:hypothetical protein